MLGTLVLVPYLALAAAFLLLGAAIARSGGSIWSIFDSLLHQALWIVPWGLIGAAGLIIAIATLGVFPESRRIGGACLAALAAGSIIVLVTMDSSGLDAGSLTFLAPCAGVLVLGLWLASGP